MQLPIYQIDAFAQNVFEGNPAAVVPLDTWLPEETMQAIAAENNLSETAFFVRTDMHYHIRWFTPTVEVPLCGHATLASAYVLFEFLGHGDSDIVFDSLSGPLMVSKQGERLTMDFPAKHLQMCAISPMLVEGLGCTPDHCLADDWLMAVLKNEEALQNISPDMTKLMQLEAKTVIATAPSQTYDFVARVFAPKAGIPEDPVTGSAYTRLLPYWAERLGKTKLMAKQVSARGGEVLGEHLEDRVRISGIARLYMKGEITI